MADAVESTGSLQLLLQTGPVVMATCDGAALILDSAGWEGESVSSVANGGWVCACWWGASVDQDCWTFSTFFWFVCFLFTLQLPRNRHRPYLCSRRVTSVMSHTSVSLCLLCCVLSHKRARQNFAHFSVCFRHSAPVVVVFFFFF